MAFRYFINEEKRTIVAVLDNCEGDLGERIRKVLKRHNTNFRYYESKTEMPDVFRGKARCNPQDTWDEAIGKKLAKERALEKYEKCWNRQLNLIVNQFEESVETLCEQFRDSYCMDCD